MKVIRKLFSALAEFNKEIKRNAERIWFNLTPDTIEGAADNQIDYVSKWVEQMGIYTRTESTLAEKRLKIKGYWKATGSLSPKYIQDILVAQGFPDVYVFDWWRDKKDPTQDRIPNIELKEGGPEVDPVLPPTKGYQLVDGVNYPTTITDKAEDLEYFVYVGGSNDANIIPLDPSRKEEFNTLLLKHVPAHLFIGVRVYYKTPVI